MSDQDEDFGNSPTEDIAFVAQTLKISLAEQLAPEIMLSALYYMKTHPNGEVKDALDYGLGEWLK